MDKFAGVGLGNIFLIWLVCIVFSVIAKVIAVKYPIEGLSDIIKAGA